jgi:hypothetical protein
VLIRAYPVALASSKPYLPFSERSCSGPIIAQKGIALGFRDWIGPGMGSEHDPRSPQQATLLLTYELYKLARNLLLHRAVAYASTSLHT